MCIFCFVVFVSYISAYASAWDKCKGCHYGKLAPDEKSLQNKYPTIKQLVNAAKKSDDPFMDGVKRDEKLLKEAAQEIGLK
jgi:hypothetical protein